MQAFSTEDRVGPPSDRLVAGEPLPIVIGEVIGGKYTVDAIIGVGGMGVVAAATHTALGQRVALKVMRSARMNPETADRFLREARAAVSLKSSHVAKVLDVGQLDSGLPYMIMELLEGADLCTKLEERGALPWPEAIDYILQACDALSEAHALGIVHRDLKPENLFVTERRDGTALVKLLDFGISKITSRLEATEGPSSRRAITHESTVMGSPMYMSPEQVRSAKHVDGRSDIWALGAILYELLAGHGAFYAESVPEIFVKILEKPAPRLEDGLRDAPAGLAEIIARCLEKERDKRFQTVDDLAAALANLGIRPSMPTLPPWNRSVDVVVDVVVDSDGGGLAVPATPAAGLGSPSLKRVTAETFVVPGRPSARRSKVPFVLASLAICGIALGAGARYLRLHPGSLRLPVVSAAAPVEAPAAVASSSVDVAASASAPAPVAVSPSPSASPPSAQPARAAVEPSARVTSSKARPRSGTSGTSGGARTSPASVAKQEAPTTVAPGAAAAAEPAAPATAPPAPAPPSLRRTDW